MQSRIPDIAIIITTYRRQDLLRTLLESIRDLKVGPAAIVLVDNEHSPQTAALAREFNVECYVAMDENTGGAGGFSRGVAEAYARGHEWFWLMDDDVAVLPEAICALAPWTQKTEDALAAGKPLNQAVGAYQSFRRNFDGSFFFWQYHFMPRLGIQNPFAKAAFAPGETSKPMNAICFEGGLIHRKVVEAIGLPDARFFIYWDDTVYGYLASKHTQLRLIPDYTLARTRHLSNMKVGKTRKLNTTSDMTRYYIMKNRGHMAHYLKENGDYNPFIFGIGTAYTLAKELLRLLVDKQAGSFKESIDALRRGMHDGRVLRCDNTWQPYSDIASLPAVSGASDAL